MRGESGFKSKSKIDEALPEVGVVSRTSLRLPNHLVNRNLSLDSKAHKSSLNLLATLFDCTDFKHSSTKKFFTPVSTTSWPKSSELSWAVFRRPKLAQLGEDILPKRCTYNMYSTVKLEKSSPSHQRNLEASKSFGSTIARWNMASMSEERATGSWRNLKRTLSRLFVKSGPLGSRPLNDDPMHRAAQSNATLGFLGLLGLKTALCKRYQRGLPSAPSSFSDTRWA